MVLPPRPGKAPLYGVGGNRSSGFVCPRPNRKRGGRVRLPGSCRSGVAGPKSAEGQPGGQGEREGYRGLIGFPFIGGSTLLTELGSRGQVTASGNVVARGGLANSFSRHTPMTRPGCLDGPCESNRPVDRRKTRDRVLVDPRLRSNAHFLPRHPGFASHVREPAFRGVRRGTLRNRPSRGARAACPK